MFSMGQYRCLCQKGVGNSLGMSKMRLSKTFADLNFHYDKLRRRERCGF